MKERLVCYVDQEILNGRLGKGRWLIHDGSITVSLCKDWRAGQKVFVTVEDMPRRKRKIKLRRTE